MVLQPTLDIHLFQNMLYLFSLIHSIFWGAISLDLYLLKYYIHS